MTYLYAGRLPIGFLERRSRSFVAINLKGREVGMFKTIAEARNALIEAAKTEPKDGKL